MQHTQLFLNDQLVDLSDDSPIALTFQINNLGDPQNQAGNTSNQIQIPLTQNNKRIIGNADDIRFCNNIPYTQLKAKVIQNGIEIIPAGFAEIASVDIAGQNGDTCSITILSGNVDFFDQLAYQVYDMGDITTIPGAMQLFAPYNHIWNLENAATSQAKTDGWLYPVIDYGVLGVAQPYVIDVRQMRPAFYLKTAIDILIKSTGYQASGTLLQNPFYNSVIVPFSADSFDHGTDYQAQPDLLGIVAYSTQDQTATQIDFNVGNIGNLSFDNIQSDPNMQYDGVKFTAKTIFTADILVTIPKFYFKGRVGTNASNVDIQIYLTTPADGDLVVASLNYDLVSYGFTRVPGTSGSNEQGYVTYPPLKLSGTVDFQPGYEVYIRYQFYDGRPETFIMYSGAYVTIKANNQNVLFGQEVQCERLLPGISQTDLLKDTLQRFGIICQSDVPNNTITFISLKDIIKQIPIAKDWSSKCLNVGKSNAFVFNSNYVQSNTLTYQSDDAITFYYPYTGQIGYADDIININDKTLDIQQANMIQSQFAPSLNSPFLGGYTAQILKIDTTTDSLDFSIGTSPRLLIDNKLDLRTLSGSPSVTFTDGTNNIVVNDIISAPYFFKPGGEFSLMWKDSDGQPGLRSLYYKELERILNQTKVVTRYFLLTPRDIAELDLTIPIYIEQDNAYFYINQIYQWIKGQACKVELVKIGEI